MIDKPTRIGNTELYTTRVLNMSVAKYYGVLKEYNELVVETRKLNKKRMIEIDVTFPLMEYRLLKYRINPALIITYLFGII